MWLSRLQPRLPAGEQECPERTKVRRAGSVRVGEGVWGASVSPRLLGAEGSSAGKRLLQPGPSAHRGALLWAGSGPFA